MLNGPSDAARENLAGLYGALWEEWQANVQKARPSLELARVTSDPVAWVEASSGDLAKAALQAGLVDKLGDKVEFGTRVAELAGEDSWSKKPGAYAMSELTPFLADVGTGEASSNNEIAVVTVAGTIVDGDAGPGTAGGTRIADLLDETIGDDNIKGLVVRVDSPGGSVLASEEIRRAVERYRARDIPVAISFANVAASGGYWVATAGDRIFAQPETITGSIGVFAVLPTFEGVADEIGVSAGGYQTTPLSGQPDVIAGLSPEMDAILQAGVNDTYTDFLQRVAEARGMTTVQVDAIAQGRVWDGGTARQKRLVDEFGGMEEALAWVAGQAGLEEGDWRSRYLGASEANYNSLIRRLMSSAAAPAAETRGGDLFAMAARQRSAVLGQITRDAQRLSGAQGIQAYCLECPIETRPISGSETRSLVELIGSWFAR